MSRTLGYTVQRVLEKLDLDIVNSINDSQDAVLIAREAEDTFYDLVSRNEWPERYDIISIQSVGDVNNPTALRLPDNVINVSTVMYNTVAAGETDEVYTKLKQVSKEKFLEDAYNLVSTEDTVDVAVYKGINIPVVNNKAPEFFTTFDNQYIILDSYDSSVESTVQGNKTTVIASSVPTFLMDDDYIIPLDSNTYPLYLSELTAAASMALNGVQDIESERRRARGMSRLRRSSYRLGQESTKNNFGRDGTGRS